MLSSNDVREVKFAKAMGGYKQEEVDAFLDSVEEDYRSYEAFAKNAQTRIDELTSEISQLKNSQGSLQNLLISAQQLADKIVADARSQADVILAEAKTNADKATEEAKKMLYEFDTKFAEKKQNAEKELADEIEAATKKKEAVEAATADAVKREQALFDRIKIEVAAFKTQLMEQYKKHVELISQMPDDIAMDAQRAADAVSLVIDETPDITQYVTENTAAEEENTEPAVLEPAENILEEITEETSEDDIELSSQTGFVVNLPEDVTAEPMDIFSVSAEDEEDESDDDFGFSNSFFGRNNKE